MCIYCNSENKYFKNHLIFFSRGNSATTSPNMPNKQEENGEVNNMLTSHFGTKDSVGLTKSPVALLWTGSYLLIMLSTTTIQKVNWRTLIKDRQQDKHILLTDRQSITRNSKYLQTSTEETNQMTKTRKEHFPPNAAVALLDGNRSMGAANQSTK